MELKRILAISRRIPALRLDLYWLQRHFPHPAALFAWTGLFFTLLGLLSALIFLRYVEKAVKNMPYFQISTQHLTIQKIPQNLMPFVDAIEPIGLSSLDIFEPRLTSKIADAYLKNPWVFDVITVKYQYPNQIFAQISLRQPCAVVYYDNQYFLCDLIAVRLPKDFSDQSALPDFLPMIFGIDTQPPAPGQIWSDPLVKEALCTADFFQQHFPEHPLQAIYWEKLPEQTEKSMVLCQDQIRIIWGTGFNPPVPQITARQKIQALQHALANLEANDHSQICEVDVRFGYAILRTKTLWFTQFVPKHP